MSLDFIRPEVDELRPRISVIGVGGAGGNAIANMMRADVQGVEFLVANTDAQALNASEADRRIQLGLKITQGLGAGSRPEIGRAAAEESQHGRIEGGGSLRRHLQRSDCAAGARPPRSSERGGGCQYGDWRERGDRPGAALLESPEARPPPAAGRARIEGERDPDQEERERHQVEPL